MGTIVKVLIVDDEIYVLRSLVRLFRTCEFEVAITSSSSPIDAYHLFETEGPFDIVLSDFLMPVMNGIDLVGRIRSKWPGTVNIILSGHADMVQINKAIAEGLIKYFVTKPWNDGDLLQLVRNEALCISLPFGSALDMESNLNNTLVW